MIVHDPVTLLALCHANPDAVVWYENIDQVNHGQDFFDHAQCLLQDPRSVDITFLPIMRKHMTVHFGVHLRHRKRCSICEGVICAASTA